MNEQSERPHRSEARTEAPVADKHRRSRVVHGVELIDDYGWLSERDSERTVAHLERENRYADESLAPLEKLRDTLYEEFLSRIEETDLTVPARVDDYLYYTRTVESLAYPIFCRRRGSMGAPEEVLLDVNELAAGLDYCRIGAIEVSPDHHLLAYAVDPSGGESFEIRFRDLGSGLDLEDRVLGASGSIAWANDNRTIFYCTLDAARRPYKVWRHRLDAAGGDVVVFREDDQAFFVSIDRTRSRKLVLIRSESNVTTEVRSVPADRPEIVPEIVEPRSQGIRYSVDHHGDSLYLRTNRDAPNFRVVRRSLDASGGEVELIPHRNDVKIESIELFADWMVVRERDRGLERVRILSLLDGADRFVELSESVYALREQVNEEFHSDAYRFAYTSMVTPETVVDCDLVSGELEILKVKAVPGGYDPSAYVTGRLEVDSGGVLVPVTYVHRRGLERNGSNPCLLQGYGAYGLSLEPTFSPALVSLLDRGFVYAIAHVRGGGLMGESWHEGGRMLAKPNSFADFIAVAEHLIEAGYTASERLAVRGGSAGGLLVGTALNLRPDLFAAAVLQVPFVDALNTMLDPSLPLTVTEFEEWGNPADAAAFECIRSYSPYDNIGEHRYPPMLVAAGLNDPRVQYWESAKWVAKLRERKTDDNMLILRTHMTAGHAGPSGRYQALRERALEYAFLIDTLT
jgi:oligopeptidase B